MLWLALHLTRLPLDLLAEPADAAPLAIVVGDGQGQRVLVCNDAAAAAGVRAGLKLAASLALCGNLRVRARDEAAEAAALDRLATWALGFTSHVGIHAPATLMLEVAASRLLFGGVLALCRRAARELGEMGYRALAAAAPTPAAARVLARLDRRTMVQREQRLPDTLAPVPITHAELDDTVIAGLTGVGARTFGDLAKLPRAELARRFGRELVPYLDRVYGRRADPVVAFEAPATFRAVLELSYAVEHVEGLMFTLKRLLRELAAWLRVRQFALLRAEVALTHEDHEPTRVTVGLCEPSGDADHLLRLAREQLDRVALPQAVRTLGVEALQCVPIAGDNRDLFAPQQAREDIARVIERLRSRLGDDAVSMVALRDDHRPEHATRPIAPSATVRHDPLSPPAAERPVFLLQPAQPLELWLRRDAPVRMEGPERIESGWWDEGPAVAARDYYRLVMRDGAHLWVYRERAPAGAWFVHGLFA